MHHRIEINRAPVLTLWAAVVAERLGFDWQEALTLGRAVAGLNAYGAARNFLQKFMIGSRLRADARSRSGKARPASQTERRVFD